MFLCFFLRALEVDAKKHVSLSTGGRADPQQNNTDLTFSEMQQRNRLLKISKSSSGCAKNIENKSSGIVCNSETGSGIVAPHKLSLKQCSLFLNCLSQFRIAQVVNSSQLPRHVRSPARIVGVPHSDSWDAKTSD